MASNLPGKPYEPVERPRAAEPEDREYQVEFETAGLTLQGAQTARRPDAISLSYLVAHTVGGVSFADPSLGLIYRAWQAEATNHEGGGGEVRIRPSTVPLPEVGGWGAWQTLFTFTGAPILELDVTVQQNGDFIVCAERATGVGGASEIWLYWYNPVAAGFAFEVKATGRSPRMILDEPTNVEDSDILLFYVSDTGVEMRQQRDTYDTIHTVPLEDWLEVESGIVGPINHENTFIEDIALTHDRRVAILASVRNPELGTYQLYIRESAPYPVRAHGEVVVVHDLATLVLEKESDTIIPEAEETSVSHSLGRMSTEEMVLVVMVGDGADVSHNLISMEPELMVILHEAEAENLEVAHDILTMTAELVQITMAYQPPEDMDVSHRLGSLKKELV